MTNTAGPTMNLVASILAAIATVVLAVFAILQWKTMNKNNEVVRDRWKREDEIHTEENKPRAALWLNKSQDNDRLELCCANLGITNFIISGIQADPLQGESIKFSFNQTTPIIVPIGTMRSVSLKDPEKMFGSNNLGNVGIKLILQGPSGEVETDAKASRLWFHNGQYMMKDVGHGFQGFERIYCPKCETWAANFNVDGMTSTPDCRSEITEVKREFGTSCPSHISTNSKVTFGA